MDRLRASTALAADQSCSTWIRATARPTAIRKAAPTTATSAAPATTRCSCSTSSAISSGARCGPGNVHSADGWRARAGAGVARYRERDLRRYFRGDAAFANPEIYEFLEAEGYGYAIRLPANRLLQEQDRLPAQASRSGDRRTRSGATTPASAIRRRAGTSRATSWPRSSGIRASCTPRRLHRHQPAALCRAGRRLLQPARHGEQLHQGRQERDQVDAAVVPLLRRQRGASSAPCPGLQPRQLHADAGDARGRSEQWSLTSLREKLVKIGAKVVQPRALRHLPDGRGRGAEGTVREYPVPDRRTATTTGSGIGLRRSGASSPREKCV